MAYDAADRGGRVPAPDAARLESIRATLDPAACEGFGEGERKAVADLLDRILSDVRTGDLTEARARLTHVEAALSQLDSEALEPRRGLAGLFDGRGRRLKAFRQAFQDAARTVADTAGELAERAGAVGRRDAGLETLWSELRDRLQDLHAHAETARSALSPLPTGEEPDAQAGLRARSGALAACRDAAVAALPLVRAAQNADAPALAALEKCAAAVSTWREEWTDALGLGGRRPRKLRPDRDRLERARAALRAGVAAAAQRIDGAQARRAEIIGRLQDLRRGL